MIQSKPGLTIGVNVALAMLAHSKPGAFAGGMENAAKTSSNGSGKKVAAQKFAEDCYKALCDSGRRSVSNVEKAWGSLVFAAGSELRCGTPMSYDEVCLWLQSYNAGPYACLKYKGSVPYRETRNYVPRILKYYQQDLSDSPYDDVIVEKATKYGLDPQLIRAVVKAESDFKRKCVSHAGARGLMQVMPCVWQDMRKRYDFDWDYDSNVFDPAKNVDVACAYLAWLRYDFLPRHFEEFPVNPEAPTVVKRDKRRMKDVRISAREERAKVLITKKTDGAGKDSGA